MSFDNNYCWRPIPIIESMALPLERRSQLVLLESQLSILDKQVRERERREWKMCAFNTSMAISDSRIHCNSERTGVCSKWTGKGRKSTILMLASILLLLEHVLAECLHKTG